MKALGVFLGRLFSGARRIELIAFLFLAGLVVWVYSEKARAGRQRAEIVAVEGQIRQEARRVRLLKAEVAHLERPQELARLSVDDRLGPASPKHDITLADLPTIAQGSIAADAPQPKAPAPPLRKTVIVAANANRSGAPQ